MVTAAPWGEAEGHAGLGSLVGQNTKEWHTAAPREDETGHWEAFLHSQTVEHAS